MVHILALPLLLLLHLILTPNPSSPLLTASLICTTIQYMYSRIVGNPKNLHLAISTIAVLLGYIAHPSIPYRTLAPYTFTILFGVLDVLFSFAIFVAYIYAASFFIPALRSPTLLFILTAFEPFARIADLGSPALDAENARISRARRRRLLAGPARGPSRHDYRRRMHEDQRVHRRRQRRACRRQWEKMEWRRKRDAWTRLGGIMRRNLLVSALRTVYRGILQLIMQLFLACAYLTAFGLSSAVTVVVKLGQPVLAVGRRVVVVLKKFYSVVNGADCVIIDKIVTVNSTERILLRLDQSVTDDDLVRIVAQALGVPVERVNLRRRVGGKSKANRKEAPSLFSPEFEEPLCANVERSRGRRLRRWAKTPSVHQPRRPCSSGADAGAREDAAQQAATTPSTRSTGSTAAVGSSRTGTASKPTQTANTASAAGKPRAQDRKPAMDLFVKGLAHQIVVLEVNPSDTIDKVKRMLYQKTDIPPSEQYLTFGGRPLKDESTLRDYKIGFESTLELTMRLRGGADPAKSRLKRPGGTPGVDSGAKRVRLDLPDVKAGREAMRRLRISDRCKGAITTIQAARTVNEAYDEYMRVAPELLPDVAAQGQDAHGLDAIEHAVRAVLPRSRLSVDQQVIFSSTLKDMASILGGTVRLICRNEQRVFVHATGPESVADLIAEMSATFLFRAANAAHDPSLDNATDVALRRSDPLYLNLAQDVRRAATALAALAPLEECVKLRADFVLELHGKLGFDVLDDTGLQAVFQLHSSACLALGRVQLNLPQVLVASRTTPTATPLKTSTLRNSGKVNVPEFSPHTTDPAVAASMKGKASSTTGQPAGTKDVKAASTSARSPKKHAEDPNQVELDARWTSHTIGAALGFDSSPEATGSVPGDSSSALRDPTSMIEVELPTSGEMEELEPDTLYRLSEDESSHGGKGKGRARPSAYGWSRLGAKLLRELPSHLRQVPGHTDAVFVEAFDKLASNAVAMVIDVFTAPHPYVFRVLTSPAVKKLAMREDSSILFRCSPALAPQLMPIIHAANKEIASYLEEQGSPDPNRPRLVVRQYATRPYSHWHSKQIIARLVDGSLAILTGSGNISSRGFGGDGPDAEGRASSSWSFETGVLEIFPPGAVAARKFLAGLDAAELHLYATERVLVTTAVSTSKLEDADPAVKKARERERNLKKSGSPHLRAARAVQKATIEAQLKRNHTYVAELPAALLSAVADPSAPASVPRSPIQLGDPPIKDLVDDEEELVPTAGELERGIKLMIGPDGCGIVRDALRRGSAAWEQGNDEERVEGYLLCFSCGVWIPGSLPASTVRAQKWSVNHAPEGTAKHCSNRLRAFNSAFYHEDDVADLGEGQEDGGPLTRQDIIDIMIAASVHESATDMRLLHPIFAWYSALDRTLESYSEIIKSLQQYVDEDLDSVHPVWSHLKKILDELAQNDNRTKLARMLEPLRIAYEKLGGGPREEMRIFPGRLDQIVDSLWPKITPAEV